MGHMLNFNETDVVRYETYLNASWLAVSTSTSDIHSDGLSRALGAMRDMTGATVTVEKGEYCDVVTASYFDEWEELEGGSMGEKVFMKWVHNKAYTETKTGHTVAQYEEYIAKVTPTAEDYMLAPRRLCPRSRCPSRPRRLPSS